MASPCRSWLWTRKPGADRSVLTHLLYEYWPRESMFQLLILQPQTYLVREYRSCKRNICPSSSDINMIIIFGLTKTLTSVIICMWNAQVCFWIYSPDPYDFEDIMCCKKHSYNLHACFHGYSQVVSDPIICCQVLRIFFVCCLFGTPPTMSHWLWVLQVDLLPVRHYWFWTKFI